MKKITVLILLFSVFSGLKAQNTFDSSLIPDSLKENADAVVRTSRTEIVRTGLNKYTEKVYQAVTILNPAGKKFSRISVGYDGDSEITDLKATVYDGSGKVITTVKKNDFSDYASNNDFTLYSDSRIRYYAPAINSYPYTVEYNYTIENKSLISLSTWQPADGYNISVLQARLTVTSPKEFAVRYKSLNYDFNFTHKTIDEKEQYCWLAENLKAVKADYATPGFMDIIPLVMVEPNEFSYDGYAGDFSSWKNYGLWVNQLLQGRDELPAETIAKIQDLTANAASDKEKVSILYKYMQSKTHYINISLGIGGFQPMKASDVDAKNYGDCKALSNYMRSLLKQVGIKAYYCEIGNGDDQEIKFPDFPAAIQTNHAICCVPLQNDTIWLECTNQNVPVGYIGAGNSNRYALMITEEGGKLARTPIYRQKENVRENNVELNLDDTGALSFNSNSEFKNAEYTIIYRLKALSKDDQKKALLSGLNADGLVLNDYIFEEKSDSIPEASLKLSGQLSGLVNKAGTHMLVKPSFLFRDAFPVKLDKNRTTPVYESIGYEYHDRVTLKLPQSIEAEHLPEAKELNTDYGYCSYTYEQVDGGIQINRIVRINEGKYTADNFAMINSFLDFCDKMERTRIVLKKI